MIIVIAIIYAALHRSRRVLSTRHQRGASHLTKTAATGPARAIRIRRDMRRKPARMRPTGSRLVRQWHGAGRQPGPDRLQPSPIQSLLVVRVLVRKVDVGVVCALDSHYERQCGEG
jgi:hypothetical protein